VINLYKFDQDRWGGYVMRFLSFKNDKEHKLGDTPIPGGNLKVYRSVDTRQHLSYEGQSGFKYIPVNEDVELNIGSVSNVIVEPTLMNVATDNYRYDRHGNISGWDDIQTWQIEVRNTRPIDIKLEIHRSFDTQYWDITNGGSFGEYEKEDLDTVKYTLNMAPFTRQTFTYTVRLYRGLRQGDWTP
jgi:hypothetical protein